MKSVVSVVLCFAMVGCSLSQVEAEITNIEQRALQLAPLAGGVVELVDPALAPLVQPFVQKLQAAAADINTLIAGYKTSPSDSALQKINAAVADGQANIASIIDLVQVKDQAHVAKVQGWAQIFSVFFADAASFVATNGTAAQAKLLPAVFGWHLPGVDLVAIDGSQMPQPSKTKAVKSGFNARDVAKLWKKLSPNTKVKLPTPRMHLFGIPLPFTGHNPNKTPILDQIGTAIGNSIDER